MIRALRVAVVACAVAVSACAPAARGAGAGRTITLSIVGTNDLHGGVLASNGQGGLALLAGYVANLRAARAADQGAVLLLDGGDLFQGTLESNLNEGAVVIASYNALGYAASAIGNHEFDFGPAGESQTPRAPGDDPRGALKARAREAHFPFLTANIIDESTGQPVAWPNVRPSMIVTAAGVRVGIVGLATNVTLSATMAANTRGLAIAPLAPALAAEAQRLRAAGASVVVAVAHAGGVCRVFDDPHDLSSCAANEEIFNVARAIPAGAVDVIVAGHRHYEIAHEVAGIAIIESRSGGRTFGRVDLTIDGATHQVLGKTVFRPHDICAFERPDGACAAQSDVSAEPAVYEGRAVIASRQIDDILAPAIARANVVKSVAFPAEVLDPLPEVSDGESALGNLLADWMRSTVPDADAGIANSGGVRAALPAGVLTFGRLYAVTPFDNRAGMMQLTGAQLSAMVRANLQTHDSFLLLSGVRATASCQGPNLVVALRRESSGRAIGDDEMLTIAADEFILTGGDGFLAPVMPIGDDRIHLRDTLMRDEIAARLRASPHEWRASDLFDPGNRRVTFPGPLPVRCSSF